MQHDPHSVVDPKGDLDRRSISFSQAEGAVALPSQLALREVSNELIARLWDVIQSSLRSTQRTTGLSYAELGGVWPDILRKWHIEFEHGFADEYSKRVQSWEPRIKAIFASRDYLKIFDFIQFVARRIGTDGSLYKALQTALTVSRSAYLLHDGTLFPKVSEEEGAALTLALNLLGKNRLTGARKHLFQAGLSLSSGDYPGSVRESISAVESVVLVLDPSTDKIGAALSNLERAGKIHRGLKTAFGALYGYTSDSEGIRHALVFENAATVDETDAIFMLGACASFVTFVIRKGALTE
ncbi:AbiJ-NTD4 domain-containing protein [Sphingomonas sp. PP-CE-3G-477]|uniref:AbiJ-NTD4 domain-containing protein n=1 Tax=Sphingomonas sp. PP-CE-3G-477 TaxID=2135660 RepID=UPI0011B1E5C8|nr:hypothetical protein [Sphingomonas sp. PP-CE-3G-477]